MSETFMKRAARLGLEHATVPDMFDRVENLQIECAALKHAQQAVETERDNAEGMAESMRMFRADMIEAGVIAEGVPPMFMTEAILGAIGKARAEALRESIAIVESIKWPVGNTSWGEGYQEGAGDVLKEAREKIAALKSQQPAQADKDKP